jgi:hypothetical protein
MEGSGRVSADRGRYSKVSRRIWNDAAFRQLSQPKPCGAWLFFRLLTGPELTNIPGLFQAWEAGLAQALGWNAKDFQKAFGEAARAGLVRADWKVGLIWLPKAVNHNEPESPNVVASWKTAWEELPDCQLRAEAWSSLKAWCEAKGEAWAKAFEKATGKPSVYPSPNQKQEQEQEQEQKPPNPLAFRMHAGWKPSDETLASFDVALIPRWASELLVSRHRSHFAAKASDLRTDEDWNQSCSKWVHGDWSNPKKRPARPDPGEQANGGYGEGEGYEGVA